jgi:hypothetical protein
LLRRWAERGRSAIRSKPKCFVLSRPPPANGSALRHSLAAIGTGAGHRRFSVAAAVNRLARRGDGGRLKSYAKSWSIRPPNIRAIMSANNRWKARWQKLRRPGGVCGLLARPRQPTPVVDLIGAEVGRKIAAVCRKRTGRK